MAKHRFSDNIFLSCIWIMWSIALGFYLAGNFLSCAVTAILSFLALIFCFIHMRSRLKTMFGKKTETVVAEPMSQVVDGKKNTNADARRCTIVAKSSVFKGDIDVEGDIQIWGKVIGNIRVKEGAIRVMHAGQVEGELSAPEIIIDGNVEGTCCAATLDILEHGELRGISRCGSMSIKRGGLFLGQSEQIENKEKSASERVVPIKDSNNDKSKDKATVKTSA
ncbi:MULTISPECIES: bactofilin family protein [Photorhabdus]|uniref:Ybca protein transcriptional activator n=2 Tax=Photorhabdus asymbiotica TaxID=291112 RepID=B6VK88_PHOAA|nr:polymer-forming cytoskeletal protein [Photorhabdus asymbiotica]CAQ83346.1 ybca protein transcriptional activator [Photorhabdus asymbiotica]CAR66568.1 ybca protein transcriptional activator [Photorhabdus asymbiotica subsp. asymbiotica ATCC 43949]